MISAPRFPLKALTPPEEYTYDEGGNLTKLVYFNPDGATQIWEREYKLVFIPCGATAQIDRAIAMRVH